MWILIFPCDIRNCNMSPLKFTLRIHLYFQLRITSGASIVMITKARQLLPGRERKWIGDRARGNSIPASTPCLQASPKVLSKTQTDLWHWWDRNLPKFRFSWSLDFSWSRVALQCCVRFCRTVKWISYCCSVAQSCLTLCNPMDCSTPGSPVHHYLPEFAQTHVHWVDDAIQPPHPLSSPSPPAFLFPQHQGLVQWVSSSHQVAKVLELQLQHQFFHWIFRTELL